VTFVVLDTQIGKRLRYVRTIAEPILVLVVLKLVQKRFRFQVHQC
jgi:hypothetical protein